MNWDFYIQFLKDFFLDRQFLVLLSSTINLFEIPKIDSNSKFVSFINRLVYFSKYLIIFPVYSFIWFLIFSFLLVLIAKSMPIGEIMFFGIIIVSVTRIAAYVSSKLAEDMAKLLPWALIIIFLTDPKSITLETIRISFT